MTDELSGDDRLEHVLERTGAVVALARDRVAGLRVVKPPHEFVGIVRTLCLVDGHGLVGLDVYGGSLDVARIWRKQIDGDETQLVDVVSADAWGDDEVDHLANEIAGAFGASPSNVDTLRAEIENDLTDADIATDAGVLFNTLLLAVPSNDVYSVRRMVGGDVEQATIVGHLIEAVEGVAPSAVEDFRRKTERALRNLVKGSLDSPNVLAEAEGHERLRGLAANNPLKAVAFSPLLLSSDASVRSLQGVVRALSMGDLRERLDDLSQLHRWLGREAKLLTTLVIPALTSGEWTHSDEEARSYADLAATLTVLGDASALLGAAADFEIDLYARALFYTSPARSGREALALADVVISQLRRDVAASATVIASEVARSLAGELFLRAGGDLSFAQGSELFGVGDISRRVLPDELDVVVDRGRVATVRESLPVFAAKVAKAVEPIKDEGIAELTSRVLLHHVVRDLNEVWIVAFRRATAEVMPGARGISGDI